MRRLLLVRHAPTTATRSFAFPADEPLDDRGRDAAVAFGAAIDHGAEVLSSERLAGLMERIGGWLDRQMALDGRAVAVTHGGVVKAAAVHALRAPLDTFWRIDAAPLAVTEIHCHDGRWTVSRINSPW